MTCVSFVKEGNLGIIEIDYPKTLNSLCTEVRESLKLELTAAAQSDVRVIVIKGNQRAFSTGGDLGELSKIGDPVAAKEYVADVHTLIRKIHQSSKVTIALVEGYAVGAGLSLAAACDMIYAAEGAKFAIPFLNVGLVPDCGASYLVSRLIGIQKAKELTFSGETFDSAEAYKLGLVARVLANDTALEEAKQLATKIAARPAKALALTKANFELAVQVGLEATLDLEEAGQAVCIFGAEHAEGRTAFFEKRKPKF
ncbi:enoyl-CoA hydratase-related protein [Metallumcola ferriviriculae]|uniref:Enoyl-CoA hydratase-related protein n=1 Tax=Metallumcola ferriviriculae TaxID=3039180 RepID=A0AAU0UME9_9FIRM|nr:enoyl-CoA hydratase-related protein [Desulfitibacteraceae bacterium MK1]